jgi:hypothetical protein
MNSKGTDQETQFFKYPYFFHILVAIYSFTKNDIAVHKNAQ